jgi:hypothetical protein
MEELAVTVAVEAVVAAGVAAPAGGGGMAPGPFYDVEVARSACEFASTVASDADGAIQVAVIGEAYTAAPSGLAEATCKAEAALAVA